MAMTVTDFLLARIAEDEEAARAAIATVAPDYWDVSPAHGNYYPEDIAFWKRVTPARMLVESEVKRAIIQDNLDDAAAMDGEWACCHSADDIRAGLCPLIGPATTAIRLLAAVYSDHADYLYEWTPGDGA